MVWLCDLHNVNEVVLAAATSWLLLRPALAVSLTASFSPLRHRPLLAILAASDHDFAGGHRLVSLRDLLQVVEVVQSGILLLHHLLRGLVVTVCRCR